MKVTGKDGVVREFEFEQEEGKKAFWHSSAHVLAQAVKRLYPETKCAIGPAIENGFYYDFEAYAKQVEAQLKREGIRCEVDKKDEKLGYKIREAQLDKVPYMVILGQKEEENGLVSVRKRDAGDMGNMDLQQLIELLDKEKEE